MRRARAHEGVFMKACGIGVLMRRARLRLIKYHRDDLDWGVVLVSCHAKGKIISAFVSDVYLMRAWFLGPASAEPTGKSEEAYSWNLHGSWGAGLPGHVRNLRVTLGIAFWFPVWPADPERGALPGPFRLWRAERCEGYRRKKQ